MRELQPSDIAAMDRDQAETAIRERARPVYLGGGRVLTRVLGRYKMVLDGADRGFAANLLMDGFWEIWLTQFFARQLKRGMTVIDVGANYGYYSLLFGDIVSPAGKVVAVEPNPAVAAALRENLTLNGMAGHVEAVEAALGADERDRVALHVPPGEAKAATLIREFAGQTFDTVEVRQTTLDMLAPRLPPIDFVKIDAEGAELAIVDGMARLLATRRPALVLEFNLPRYAEPAAFLERLRQAYGALQVVGFDGLAQPIAADTILSTRIGEDWLLYCATP